MDLIQLGVSFVILMFIICGFIIFILKRTFITSTEGALKRLDADIAKANAQQAELSQKLKDADEELSKRRAEAKELADKMRSDAEEETKKEKEKIVADARKEGEEIITKAQNATEKLKTELEKEMDIRAADLGVQLLTNVLSEKAKSSLDHTLVDEFITNLRETDMSKISKDVSSAEVVTLTSLDEGKKGQLSQIIKEKLGRDISLSATIDDNLGGGMVLKFGSMALDGSLKALLRDESIRMQETIDAK